MFATEPYRRISDDRRKPLARYGAMGARFASGLLICYTTSWDTTFRYPSGGAFWLTAPV